jgi:hypothetical protein
MIVTGISTKKRSVIYSSTPLGLLINSDPILLGLVGRSILFLKSNKIISALVPIIGYMYSSVRYAFCSSKA